MFDNVLAGLRALHAGLWLGLLTPEQLNAATIAYYSTEQQFLDPQHNLSGLLSWEARAIDKYTKSGTRVLVPAAGAGREILALAGMDYEATGYDPTPELVQLGNHLIAQSGSNARLLASHGNETPSGLTPPYDWVLFGWAGVTHIQGRQNRAAVFEAIHDLLVPGGVLIASFLHRRPRSPIYDMIYRVARTIRDLRRIPDQLELGDTFDGSFDHRFTFPEILHELRAAGFEELTSARAPYPHVVCVRS